MKLKTTNKEIRANFSKILQIGYCDAQYLLTFKKPFAYTTGVYGWSADFYEIGGVCISTGYRPIGVNVDYKLLDKLEREAATVCNNYNISYDEQKKQLDELLETLINSVKF